MDDTLEFRKLMAESGVELTPAAAQQSLDFLEKICSEVEDHPQILEILSEMTMDEKREIVTELAERGREITLQELDDLIYLIMYIHGEDT